jgi:two-component system NtrC family sensor kinase
MYVDYDRQYLVTAIEDTGHGIPEDHLVKVFDPFFTTKDQPAQGLAGTGLGLSVSYGIIQNHGGHIGVKSEVGKGTVFTIELPLFAAAGYPAQEYAGKMYATG